MASHVAPKSILKRRDETANTTDDDYQQRMINRQSVSWKDIVETESESTYLENPPSHQQRPRKHKATHRSSSSWRKAIEASLYGDGAQQGEALPLTSNVTPNNKNPQSPSEKGSISTTCKPRSQRDDHVQQRENNGNFSQKNNKCSPEFSDMTSRQPSSRIMMHKHQQEMQETYSSTSGNNKPFRRLGNTSSFCSLEASERNECWPKPFEAKYASGTDSFSDEESTAPKKQHLPYDNPIKTSLHETIRSKTGKNFIHDPTTSDFEETEQHSFQERRGRNVNPQRPKKLDVQLRHSSTMASHVAPKSILKRRDETANTTDDDYQQRMINRQSVSWKDIVETESESTYLANPQSHQQRPRKHKATHRSSSSWRKAIEASLYGDGAQQGEALPLTSNVTPNNKNPQSPSEKGSISTSTCKPRSVCQPASDNRALASDSFARRRMPRHQDENNDHQQQSKPNPAPEHDINTRHVNRNSKVSKKIDPRSRAESTERVRSIPVVHKPIRRRTSVTTTTRDLHDADDDEGQEGHSKPRPLLLLWRKSRVALLVQVVALLLPLKSVFLLFTSGLKRLMTSRQPSSRIMMHKHQQEMQETYSSTSGNNKPFRRLGNTSSFCSLEASERNECWPKPFEAKYASGTDSFSDEESTAPKKQHLPYDNPIKTSLHETISSKTGEKFIHDPITSDFEETEQHSFQERRGRNVNPQRPKKLDVQLRRERSPDMLKPHRKSVAPKPSSTKLSQTFNKEHPSERFVREFHDTSYPTSGRDEAPHFPEKPNRKSPPEKFARKSIQGSEDSGFNRNQEYRDADSLLEYASTQKKSRLERSRVTATVSSHNQSTTINSAENDASEVPLPQRLKQILNPDPTLNPFRPKLNPQTSVTRDTNNKGIRGLHSKTSMESNPYRDSDTGLAEEHKEDPCLLSKASMKFKRNAFVNEVDIDSYAKFDDEDDRELISSGCQSPPSAQILNIGRHMIKRPRPSAMNIPKTSRGDSAARQRVLDRSEPSTKSFDVSFCQHLLVANEPLPEDDEMSTKTDTVSTSKSVEIGEENNKPVANIRTKVATCRTTSSGPSCSRGQQPSTAFKQALKG
ncbi:unnamed protein product [Notodromas monacha]|uniref:Uncharacterized protein n=1 Tax=Notodromas monacha TaxID=399045 RepID=A0A7R9GGY3_9CRUS|nr:unnamed protein product [Notodromas monacha]CAG0920725.1 unnamed protein product [Notodromas monacha]